MGEKIEHQISIEVRGQIRTGVIEDIWQVRIDRDNIEGYDIAAEFPHCFDLSLTTAVLLKHTDTLHG